MFSCSRGVVAIVLTQLLLGSNAFTPPTQNRAITQLNVASTQPESGKDRYPEQIVPTNEEVTGWLQNYGEASRVYRRDVFSAGDWVRSRRPDRFVGNIMTTLDSSLMRNIVPELKFITAAATFICFYNILLVDGVTDFAGVHHDAITNSLPRLMIPYNTFSLPLSALGLLLSFRTNVSYSRWNQARTAWGKVINDSRSIMRMGGTWGRTYSNASDEQILLLGEAICSFSRALMNRLLTPQEDGENFKTYCNTRLTDKVYAEELLNAKHRPTAALAQITKCINDLDLNPLHQVEAELTITGLCDALGASERLFTSPVPTFYTRHTARFLAFFLVTMPLAFYDPMKVSWNHWEMIPATALIGAFLLGIEELATQMEEPFSILPMEKMAEGSIRTAVMEQVERSQAAKALQDTSYLNKPFVVNGSENNSVTQEAKTNDDMVNGSEEKVVTQEEKKEHVITQGYKKVTEKPTKRKAFINDAKNGGMFFAKSAVKTKETNEEINTVTADEERLAAEKQAEEARIAAEKLEQERIAAERAEEARLAAVKKLEEERIAAEMKAEGERIAAEKKAEEARMAAVKIAEEAKIAAEKAAEEARIAAEKAAEEARIAAEKAAEEARIAAEKAEQERIAAEKKVEEARIAAAKKAEEERLAAEKAEQERIAAVKAEQERIAAEKAEQERIAAVKAEQERIAAEKAAEEARIAAEKAEQERMAAMKAEQERIAAVKAEQERMAAMKAEQERIAAVKAEQERIAAEKAAEEARIAAERAEQERIAAVKAEQERIAAVKAEQERIAAEKAAEEERIAAERAEQERIAAVKAEQERIAAEKAEQERIAAEKAAEEARIAAERAEQERIAAERAEQERIAAEKKAAEERLAAEKKAEEERIAAEMQANKEQNEVKAQQASTTLQVKSMGYGGQIEFFIE